MITFQRNTEGTKPINSFLSFFFFSFLFFSNNTLPEKRLYGDLPGIFIHPLLCCWPASHPGDATPASALGRSGPATLQSLMIPKLSSRLYKIKIWREKKNNSAFFSTRQRFNKPSLLPSPYKIPPGSDRLTSQTDKQPDDKKTVVQSQRLLFIHAFGSTSVMSP